MVPATFDSYEHVAERLLAACDKEVIAQAARVLALYVGYYQRRHGLIGAEVFTGRSADSVSPDEAADRAEGMRALAAALTLGAAVSQPAADE